MSDQTRADRLRAITGLMKDRDLIRLRQAAAERDAVLSRLAAIDQELARARAACGNGDTALTDAATCDRLRLFSAHQRASANTELAARTAEWSGARTEAARALGREAAADRLAAQVRALRITRKDRDKP